jgi:hypothetical protein
MTTKATGTKTLPKKVAAKPAAKKTLEKTNKKVITQKVISNRELKYKYPRGCKDTLARKAFRQKVRNAIRKMERDIAKQRGEDRRVLKEKLAAYQAEHLM